MTLDWAVNQEMHLCNKRKNSGSRWTLGNNISWCPGGSTSAETGMSKWEPACRGLGPQRPTVEQPQQICERSVAIDKRKTWVDIAVCPCLHSSLAYNRTSHFRKLNVRDLYFCKVYSLVIEVVHYWLMMFSHTGSLAMWVECSPMVREFNPRSRHTKEFKNGTWYLLA